MPPKTIYVSENTLKATPLPNHGKKYQVVPHDYVISETKKELRSSGFNITTEFYKSSMDGQLAQGVYFIEFGNDPDIKLMFAWSNSYNKLTRFKCAIGAHVVVCGNGMLSGDMSNYRRKHIGYTALQDVSTNIKDQIAGAATHYNTLIADKEILKQVMLSPKKKGQILGELFACTEVLTLTQVGIVKRELDSPTFNYNCDPDSAWAMYNHVTFALKESHPVNFLNDHQVVHDYFMKQFGTNYVLSETAFVPAKEEQYPLTDSTTTAPKEVENKYMEDADDTNIFGVNFL